MISVGNFLEARNLLGCLLLLLAVTMTPTFSDKLFNIGKKVGGEQQQPHHQVTGCEDSCRMPEEIKQRNLEVIKGEILRKMGFSQAPNITRKVLPQVPAHFQAMVEDYGMQSDQPQMGQPVQDDDDDEDRVRTQKILTFAQPYPKLRHKGRDILHFTFSDSITKFYVSNATLFVFIRGTEKRPLPDVFIEVFKITEHSEPPSVQRVYHRKFTQPYGRGDWLKIDFGETVSEWFKSPKDNLGFIVNATANGKKVAVTDVTFDKGRKTPFVEISIIEAKRRVRRSTANNCDEMTEEPICCRYPLMVDFEVIGFDFIIAPKKYNAYMCAGDCQYLTFAQPDHIAPPCCTPRKMSAISMLYYDTQLNIVFGSLPGMVVERCG